MQSTAVEAGYDVYGNQVKTPGQVADERGQYRNKDGEWSDLGGEFWNWAGNVTLGLMDFVEEYSGMNGLKEMKFNIAYHTTIMYNMQQ